MIWHEIPSTLLLCQFFVRCEVPLPHFRPALAASAHQLCSARTFKGLKLCFRNSALSLLPTIRSSAFRTSARPGLRRTFFFFRTCSTRTSKYGYVHFRILSLPGLPKMWSSASALLLCLVCKRSEVPLSVPSLGHDFERPRSSSTLVLMFCQDFQVWVSPLLLFISARTFKDVKLRCRTSALPWLPKIWSSAFRTSARPGLERSRSSSTLVLPGIPNMDKSTSAFHLCQDFQRSEIPLPHFCFALTAKDVKFCFLSTAVRTYYAFLHRYVRI